MDKFGESIDADACSVCKEDGQTTPGTMWCTTCEEVFCDGCLKFHKKMPLLRDHEVFDVRIHSSRKRKVRRFMCTIHKEEKIKLFCKDCRMAICTVCCSLKHRKCDHVETIDAMMPLVKEALIHETMIRKKKMQTYTDNISSTNIKIEQLMTSAQEMKDKLRRVRMKAAYILFRKERKLLARIDKLTKDLVEERKAYRTSQESDLHVEQQRFELIDKTVTSDCVADIFDVYTSLDGASTDAQEDTLEDKRPETPTMIFVHDTYRVMRFVDSVKLGEVKLVGGLSDRRSSPILLERIDFSGDMFPDLRDVVFVNNGMRVIAVIDYVSCRLSTRYVPKTPSLKKHLELPSQPMGIAKVGESKAAITLPDRHQIAFINFDPEPTLQSTVKTKRKYRGLAFLNPAQLVTGTFDCPASVDILDMEGNVLKLVSTGVIRNPFYIHVMRGKNVVVSEGRVKSLVSATLDGQTIFTYTPREDMSLVCPCGVTTTSTGDILLVDSGSHKVILLTASGQFVKDVLTRKDGLWYPSGICRDNDGLLYVTSAGCVEIFGFEY